MTYYTMQYILGTGPDRGAGWPGGDAGLLARHDRRIRARAGAGAGGVAGPRGP
jgi:hypothetical protein